MGETEPEQQPPPQDTPRWDTGAIMDALGSNHQVAERLAGFAGGRYRYRIVQAWRLRGSIPAAALACIAHILAAEGRNIHEFLRER